MVRQQGTFIRAKDDEFHSKKDEFHTDNDGFDTKNDEFHRYGCREPRSEQSYGSARGTGETINAGAHATVRFGLVSTDCGLGGFGSIFSVLPLIFGFWF